MKSSCVLLQERWLDPNCEYARHSAGAELPGKPSSEVEIRVTTSAAPAAPEIKKVRVSPLIQGFGIHIRDLLPQLP